VDDSGQVLGACAAGHANREPLLGTASDHRLGEGHDGGGLGERERRPVAVDRRMLSCPSGRFRGERRRCGQDTTGGSCWLAMSGDIGADTTSGTHASDLVTSGRP